jgi:hypothetical protein
MLLPLLIAAATAIAPSPAWTRTGAAGTPSSGIGTPALLFGESGPGLVTWGGVDGTHLGSWKVGADPVERRKIPDGLVAEPLFTGRRSAFFVRQQPVVDAIARIGTSTGTLDGSPGTFNELLHRTELRSGYAVARSPRGEIALAWIEALRGGEQRRLQLAVKPRGGRFGRPVTLAVVGPAEHPGVGNVVAAYDRREGLVIAYPVVRSSRKRQVHALIGRPGHFRRQVLGRHLGITELVAATSANGRIVVAWDTQDGGEEANGPAQVRAASRDATGRLFHKTQLLDAGDWSSRTPGRLSAAVGEDGSALLSWSQVHRGVYPVVASTSTRRGRFRVPVTLDANGAAGDAVIAPDGRMLVVWSRILRGNEQEPDQIFASISSVAGFGAPEAVSADAIATRPAAAFDPASAKFAVVWSERPTGRPPEVGGGNTAVLRGASR